MKKTIDLEELSLEEASTITGGEPLTLTIVLTYLAISVVTVLVWKLYLSAKGKVSLPGGFNFEWGSTYLNPFFSLFS